MHYVVIKSKLCTQELNSSTVQQTCLALIKQRGVVTILDKSIEQLKRRMFAETIVLKGDTAEQLCSTAVNDLSHDNFLE